MAKSRSEIRSLASTTPGSSTVDADEIESIVRGVLAEQREDPLGVLDETMVKTVAASLTSFGIYDEDRKDMRADFQHLRGWRKSMEQAQSYTFKAIITLIVTGFVGIVWLGVKAMLGQVALH